MMGGGKRGSQSRRGPISQNVKVISIERQAEVKLHHVENAWKPTREAKTDADDENTKMEEVFGKFRGILNKLTPQKFQKLVQQVMELDIHTEDRLKGVIDIIFEKVAILEVLGNFAKGSSVLLFFSYGILLNLSGQNPVLRSKGL